ncbi:hypothetical protein [Vibrio aestuarianus]|nr:hypothetical protein [Vibrio aestuarianus]
MSSKLALTLNVQFPKKRMSDNQEISESELRLLTLYIPAQLEDAGFKI